MLILTSLSPNHCNKELQIDCVKSWLPYGKVWALNTQKEIDLIGKENYPDVTMLPTDKTMESLFGKSLVNISAFFELGKIHHKDILIINSDIYLKSLPDLRKDGVTVFCRYDYDDSMDVAKMFTMGYDAFYIPYEFLKHYPISVYAMGACHWDYAVPLRFIRNDVPLYFPKGRHAFHKKHKNQFSYAEWLYTGEIFAWEFKLGREKRFGKEQIVQQITTETLELIKSKFIYV